MRGKTGARPASEKMMRSSECAASTSATRSFNGLTLRPIPGDACTARAVVRFRRSFGVETRAGHTTRLGAPLYQLGGVGGLLTAAFPMRFWGGIGTGDVMRCKSRVKLAEKRVVWGG